MAIRTIEYTIDMAGVLPATEQYGGVQGDHRVTALDIYITDALYDLIYGSVVDGKVMYRFDVYDGAGGLWQSEPQELKSPVGLELEERHTHFGGKITVHLVITVLSSDNLTEMELYTFPMMLRLKNRPEGVHQDGENLESVTTLAQAAKSNAQSAENTNLAVQQLAAEVEEKLKNGEFDGVGVEKAEIVNDELIILYTDNTVQNLGNVKGEQGPQGEKGDTGAAGKDAVIDQTYNPKSENAQSGKAVESAVNNCMPIPQYEETYGIEKVAVYDDTNYLDYKIDSNGNYVESERYIPPSAIKSRPIDDGKGYDYRTGLTGSKADTANRAGYIAARDSNGNLWTGDPIDDQDCVPKKYVDDYVEKVKGNGHTNLIYSATTVYGRDDVEMLAVEDNLFFEDNIEYGTIPRRQFNGNLLTNTPVKDLDCVNKKYVDELVGDIESLLGGI